MPRQYCSGPAQPGGNTSGQRPGPSFFENSTRMPDTSSPPPLNSSSVIRVVSGQSTIPGGEFVIVAIFKLNGVNVNDAAAVNGLASPVPESLARARQK